MHRFPKTSDFNEADYPELIEIFSNIDSSIASIIASDFTFRPKPARRRRPTNSDEVSQRRPHRAGQGPRYLRGRPVLASIVKPY